MTVIRHEDARRTETPNAVATTLASPTQGGAGTTVWRMEMRPGQRNPDHRFDAEQVWTWVDGTATVRIGDESIEVTTGDTVVVPAEVERHVATETGYVAIVATPASGRIIGAEAERLLPAWMA